MAIRESAKETQLCHASTLHTSSSIPVTSSSASSSGISMGFLFNGVTAIMISDTVHTPGNLESKNIKNI